MGQVGSEGIHKRNWACTDSRLWSAITTEVLIVSVHLYRYEIFHDKKFFQIH